MDLVVTGQHLAVGTHQLGPVIGGAFAGGYGETTAQQGHLIAAGHGHQETAAALRQASSQFQLAGLLAHEGKILRQAHQVGAPTGGQLNQLLRLGEVGVRVRRAGELQGCRKKAGHHRSNPLGGLYPDGSSGGT